MYSVSVSKLCKDITGMGNTCTVYQYHKLCEDITGKGSAVSHFSYAPVFQGPYFLTKMLESNDLY